jgi:plastocyanin
VIGPRRRALAVIAAIAALAALAVTAAGCGGGGNSGSAYKEPTGASLEIAKIEAGNLFFKPDSVKLPAGIDTIELIGRGNIHTLVIDGVTGFKLRVEGDGDHDSKKVALKPGKYTFYCDIPGHREAGMEGTLSVS